MLEQTLVIIKPEAMKKNLTGYILEKLLAQNKSELLGIKLIEPTQKLTEEHYQHLKNEPYFNDLVNYFSGKKYDIKHLLAFVLEGDNIIERTRKIVGATDPEKADPTSIRGAFGRITKDGIFENVVHASGNLEDAKREINLWFKKNELKTR